MFLQNKRYIKEILFIIPFKTDKIYTYKDTVYQHINDTKQGVRTDNTRMLLIKTSGCYLQQHGDVLMQNTRMFSILKTWIMVALNVSGYSLKRYIE